MGYRDELGAAKERIRMLEADLAEARAENERLRRPVRTDAPIVASQTARRTAPTRRFGRIHYHPPPSYFPVLQALPALFHAARTSAPLFAELDSDSVLAWALHYGVRMPLTLVTWPLYWLSMGALLLPIATLLCLAGAVLLLPYVVLSRLTFSAVPPPDESTPFHGGITDDAARATLWGIASIFVVPMAFCGRLLRSD